MNKKLSMFVLSLLFVFVPVHIVLGDDSDLEIGTYYKGDGLGMNISVVLSGDGRYEATWDGCLGNYGNSSGTWEVEGANLFFKAHSENGMLEGFLGEMSVIEYNGQAAFVRADVRKEHEKHIKEVGKSFYVFTLRTP